MSISLSDENKRSRTGLYYDGQSSRAHPVFITISGGEVRLSGSGIDRRISINEVAASERFEGANRIVRFSDGTSCELPDSRQLSDALGKRGDSLTQRLQRSWRWVAVSLLLLAVVVTAGYWWGLPWAAEKIAFRMPANALRMISQQALSIVDSNVLQPSSLSSERQQQLRERFGRLSLPPVGIPIKVEFRDSRMYGANAFALPDGTIVFFDKLVQLADNDDQIAAVYAHEAGHVALRHGMRQIIQSSVVALVLAAYFGDVSSLGAALSGWLLEAKYSRSFERDADFFAADALKRNNLSPKLLSTMLQKLEETHKTKDGGGKQPDYLSSHPATEERIRYLGSIK
ncbi:MAG TPA: M48 family metallopeptidase [Dissulfurispiraceae bacterium]|nr:M48 family metallopeptidase [Dissulfurispiraceae bacterium]